MKYLFDNGQLNEYKRFTMGISTKDLETGIQI